MTCRGKTRISNHKMSRDFYLKNGNEASRFLICSDQVLMACCRCYQNWLWDFVVDMEVIGCNGVFNAFQTSNLREKNIKAPILFWHE